MRRGRLGQLPKVVNLIAILGIHTMLKHSSFLFTSMATLSSVQLDVDTEGNEKAGKVFFVRKLVTDEQPEC